jgi:protein-S-isoprenylcysteine O-methyltransferase Ste14
MDNNLKNDPHYHNHESRPDLAGEHPQGDRLQFLVFILLVISFLIDYFFLGWSTVFRRLIPYNLRLPISLIFIFIGFYLSLTGIRTVFGTYSKEPRMITSGLFSYMRHPVYLGALLIFFGLFFFFLSPLSFLALIPALILYNWLAEDEETRMIKVFGENYKEYMRKTPKWFPKIFKKQS